MLGSTATRRPTKSLLSVLAVSATTPAYSCPRTTGGVDRDVPSTMCTSVPHTPQTSTFTSRSPGSSFRIGFDVIVSDLGPLKRAAFMRVVSSLRDTDFRRDIEQCCLAGRE